MSLDKIIKEVEDRLFSKIEPTDLIALALIGSRAGGYYNNQSDFDFVAICNSNISPQDYYFSLGEYKIDINIEGKQIFEKRIKSRLHTFYEQSGFVWLPYLPIIGCDYLKDIESKARSILLDDFISSLPQNEKIKVTPIRIAEWPLINEALVWPYFIIKLKAIVNSKNKPLEEVIPKYIKSFEEKGIYLSSDGTYILQNTASRRDKISFFKKVLLKYENKADKNLNYYITGIIFLMLQLPEELYNKFYTFPKFKRRGNYLEYIGPSLEEFLHQRRYLEPLHNQMLLIRRIRRLANI